VSRLGPTPNDVRARVPDVLRSYLETRDTVLTSGIVDSPLKELCSRFLAGERVEGRDERERAALDWVRAIAWDSEVADDALWERLHAHFGEPELVELGYAAAFMLGQQHWVRTLGLEPEVPQVGSPQEAKPPVS
jgi:alkylhydroperoxidase family enzyme